MSSSINDLPIEVLEKIFILTTPWIEESIILSQVCKHWNIMMKHRFSMVEYLQEADSRYGDYSVHSSGKFLLFRKDYKVAYIKLIKRNLDLLPNLMALKIKSDLYDEETQFFEFINCKPSIKALCLKKEIESRYLAVPLRHIQMLFYRQLLTGQISKRLVLWKKAITQISCFVGGDLPYLFSKYRGLRRLHLSDWSDYYYQLSNYKGPTMEKLEILELDLEAQIPLDDINDFLKYCPRLKSIFIRYDNSEIDYFLEDTHYLAENVENLVLEAVSESSWRPKPKSCEIFLSMFPNLKNLALRYFHLKDESQISQALKILPKLEYLEIKEHCVSKSTNIDSKKIVARYQRLHARTIECCIKAKTEFEHDIYSNMISEGFDFMKNVFPRDFNRIPNFLDEREMETLDERLARKKRERERVLRAIREKKRREQLEKERKERREKEREKRKQRMEEMRLRAIIEAEERKKKEAEENEKRKKFIQERRERRKRRSRAAGRSDDESDTQDGIEESKQRKMESDVGHIEDNEVTKETEQATVKEEKIDQSSNQVIDEPGPIKEEKIDEHQIAMDEPIDGKAESWDKVKE